MTTSNHGQDFDVIVIGSGMGGLAVASILTQVGKQRVLVLESHFKLGGFLHSFRRKGYFWDPGVHYIGDMGEKSLTRQCMDLVTGGRVAWEKMHEDFERYLFPNETFRVPSCPKKFEQVLGERFPDEKPALRRYFRDVKAIQNWSHRWFFAKQFPQPAAAIIALGGKKANELTQDYLDRNFKDPLLKAVLTGQWPDYGTLPAESAFGIHAIVAADFQLGGYYPVGGSQKIADSAAAIVEEGGGACLVNHRVKRIQIDRNQATGVVVEHKGKELRFTGKRIVSNAGVAPTFNHFIASNYAQAERAKVARSTPGTSASILFLGLNDDPRKRGFENCNYWIFNSENHNENPLGDSSVVGAFLSFGSIRNPGQEPHTAQIVTFSRYEDWESHADTQWKKRGEEYEQRKQAWADKLLDLAEQRFPCLRDLVDYHEVSSPLSVESFTHHPRGQIYGRACTPSRLSDSWSIGTSVKNLYLTGSDIAVPGVNSALMIGVMTSGKLLGWSGMPRILMRAASKS